MVTDYENYLYGTPGPEYAATRRSNIDQIVDREAGNYGIDPDLVRSLVQIESSGAPDATSPAGAIGAMQIMPETGREIAGQLGEPYDPQNLYDPETNIRYGTKYLADNLKRYGGDEGRALAAYHAGPGAVDRAGGIPDTNDGIMSTRQYVGKIQQGVGRKPFAPVYQRPESATIAEQLGLAPQQPLGTEAALEPGPTGAAPKPPLSGTTTASPAPADEPAVAPEPTIAPPGNLVGPYKELARRVYAETDNLRRADMLHRHSKEIQESVISQLPPNDAAEVRGNIDEVKGAFPLLGRAVRAIGRGRIRAADGETGNRIPGFLGWNPETGYAPPEDKRDEVREQGEHLVNIGDILDPDDLRDTRTKGAINDLFFQDNEYKAAWQRGDLGFVIDKMVGQYAATGDFERAEEARKLKREFEEAAQWSGRKYAGPMKKLLLSTLEMLPPLLKSGAKAVVPGVGPLWSMSEWAAQGTGAIYDDLRKAGVSEETAARMAPVGGLFYAAIEQLQFGQIARLGGKITKGMTNKAVRSAVGRLLKQKGVDYLQEVGEEGLQQLVQDVTTELGKNIEGVEDKKNLMGVLEQEFKIEKNADGEWEFGNVWKALGGAAGPMGVLSVLGIGANAPVAMQRDTKAAQQKKDRAARSVRDGQGPKAKTPKPAISAPGDGGADLVSEGIDGPGGFLNLPEERRNEIWPRLSQNTREEILNYQPPQKEGQRTLQDVRDRLEREEQEGTGELQPETGAVGAQVDAEEGVPADAEPQQADQAKKEKAPEESIVSGQEVAATPSEAQKEAGNYARGHAALAGINVSIENPVGSTRSGKDKGGQEWTSVMTADYGYVRGTVGPDKDHIDAFLKPGTEPGSAAAPRNVYVVNQVDPETKEFDEPKVMMGYESAEAAKRAYMSNYEKGWQGFGNMVEMSPAEFKEYAYNPEISKKPATSRNAIKVLTKSVESAIIKDEEGRTPQEEQLAKVDAAAETIERRPLGEPKSKLDILVRNKRIFDRWRNNEQISGEERRALLSDLDMIDQQTRDGVMLDSDGSGMQGAVARNAAMKEALQPENVEKHGRPVALAVDLTNIGEMNKISHAFSDVVMRRVGDIFRRRMRKIDGMEYRNGGDELSGIAYAPYGTANVEMGRAEKEVERYVRSTTLAQVAKEAGVSEDAIRDAGYSPTNKLSDLKHHKRPRQTGAGYINYGIAEAAPDQTAEDVIGAADRMQIRKTAQRMQNAPVVETAKEAGDGQEYQQEKRDKGRQPDGSVEMGGEERDEQEGAAGDQADNKKPATGLVELTEDQVVGLASGIITPDEVLGGVDDQQGRPESDRGREPGVDDEGEGVQPGGEETVPRPGEADTGGDGPSYEQIRESDRRAAEKIQRARYFTEVRKNVISRLKEMYPGGIFSGRGRDQWAVISGKAAKDKKGNLISLDDEVVSMLQGIVDANSEEKAMRDRLQDFGIEPPEHIDDIMDWVQQSPSTEDMRKIEVAYKKSSDEMLSLADDLMIAEEDAVYTADDVRVHVGSQEALQGTLDAIQTNLFDIHPEGSKQEKSSRKGEPAAGEPPVILDEWKKNNYVDLKGQKIKSTRHLAELFSVYRNPGIEIMHYVLVDENNRIVAHTAMSSFLPNESKAFPYKEAARNIVDLISRVARTGAVKVYTVHNHPTGNVDASGNDKKVNKMVDMLANNIVVAANRRALNLPKTADEEGSGTIGIIARYISSLSQDQLRGLAKLEHVGSIILDHEEYGYIQRLRERDVFRKSKYVPQGIDSKRVREGRPLLNGVQAVAKYVSDIVNNDTKNVLVVADTQLVTLGWVPVPTAPSTEQIKGIVKKYSGVGAIYVTNDEAGYAGVTRQVRNEKGEHLLYDAVFLNKDGSYRSARSADAVFAETARRAKLRPPKKEGYVFEPEAEYGEQYNKDQPGKNFVRVTGDDREGQRKIKDALTLLPESAMDKVRIAVKGQVTVGGKTVTLSKKTRALIYDNAGDGLVHVVLRPGLTPSEAAAALYHEVGGHLGAVLAYKADPKLFKRMHDLWNASQKTGLAKQIKSTYKSDAKGMSAEGAERLYFNEWSATLLENYLFEGKHRGVSALVRGWWRDALISMGFAEEGVDDILRAMVRQMRKPFIGPRPANSAIYAKKNIGGPQPDDNALVALHNLSAENLRFAHAMGGLPAPSIAITQARIPFDGFGEITMIMDRTELDGSGFSLFESDIYTGRAPKVYNRANKAAANRFSSELWQARRKYEDTTGEGNIEQYLEWDDKGNWVSHAKHDMALMGMFLEEQGTEINPVMQFPRMRYGVSTMPAMAKFWEKKGPSNAENVTEEDIIPSIRKAMAEQLDSMVPKVAKIYRRENVLEETLFDEDGTLKGGVLWGLFEDQNKIRSGKKELNKSKTRAIIEEAISPKQEEFEKWVEDKASQLFGKPYLQKGKRRVPFTLDTMVSMIVSNTLRANEDTIVFSLGNARAMGARKLSSTKAAGKLRDRIVSRDKMEEIKEALNKRLTDFVTEYQDQHTQYDPDRPLSRVIDRLEDMCRAFGAYYKGRSKTNEGMRQALKGAYYNPTSDTFVETARQLADDVLDAPTQYFEGKFRRAVGLDAFSGAVIPSGTDEKTRAILAEAGIEVVEYDREVDGDRQKKVEEFSFNRNLMFNKELESDPEGLFVSESTGQPYGQGEEEGFPADAPPDWFTDLRDAGALMEAETEPSVAMVESEVNEIDKEIKRVRNKMKSLPPTSLTERALLGLQLKDYKERQHDQIVAGIYNYAKKIKLRGVPYNKVDTLLKNTRTPGGLRRAVSIMDETIARREKAEAYNRALDRIEKAYRRLRAIMAGRLKSTLSTEGNRALQRYLDNLTDVSQEERDRLNKLLSYFQQYGKDIKKNKEFITDLPDDYIAWLEDPKSPVPPGILRDVRKLFQNSLGNMTTQELQRVVEDINEIESTGRLLKKEKEEMRKQQLDNVAGAIAKQITKAARQDRKSTAMEAAQTTARTNLESATHLIRSGFFALIKPERIVESLVGWKDTGLIKKAVLRRLYNAESEKLKNTKGVLDRFREIHGRIDPHQIFGKPFMTVEIEVTNPGGESVGREMVPLTLDNMMFIYANSQNPGNRLHLNGTGYSDEVIDLIVDQLPTEYRQAVDDMIDYYDDVQYGRVSKVFRQMHDVDMPKEHRYFPVQGLATDRAESAIVADLLARHGSRMAAVHRGFTKSRIGSSAPFRKMSYMNTVVTNLAAAEHFVAYGMPVREVQRILTHPEVKDAVQANEGTKERHKQLIGWLKAVSYGREQSGEQWLDKFSDYFRRNYAQYVLAFKLTSVLQQFSSLFKGMGMVSKPETLKAIGAFGSNPYKLLKFVNERSSMMQNRMDSYERELAEWKENQMVKKATGTQGTYQKVVETGMYAMGAVDKGVASILWAAKYAEAINRGEGEAEAIAQADEVIIKTQSFGGVLYAPQLYRGRGISRAYTMFTSDLNQNLNLVYEMAGKWGQKNATEKASEIFYYFILPPTLTFLVVSAGSAPWEEPEEWGKELVSSFTSGMSILGELVKTPLFWGLDEMNRARGGRPDSFWKMYAGDFVPTSFKWLQAMIQAAAQMDPFWAFDGLAMMAGIPFNFMKRIIRNGKAFYNTKDWRFLVWPRNVVESTGTVPEAMAWRYERGKKDERARAKEWIKTASTKEKEAFRVALMEMRRAATQRKREREEKKAKQQRKEYIKQLRRGP